MTAYDTWAAILTKLATDLPTLTMPDTNQTFVSIALGRKQSPGEYPAVLVWPEPIPQTPRTANTSEHKFTFRIVAVVTIGESIVDAMKDALQRIVVVNDYLVGDRSFANNVERLEVERWTPDVYDPRVTDRHQAGLTVSFYKAE